MKFLYAFLCVMCLLLSPLGVQAQNTEALSPAVAKILEKPEHGYIILDVRTPKEYAAGHLKDAVLVDFMAADFEKQLAGFDKNAPYVLHCRTGARSSSALAVMEKMGFTHVLHMTDGIMGWMKNNLPVEK